MPFMRHAIFFTPPAGDMADFGAAWLGWDSARGQPADAPALPDLPAPSPAPLPAPVPEITATPRKYGLHATMAAPFRLAAGQAEATLLDAFTRFCGDAGPVTLDGLDIAAIGRFLALVPVGETAALDALAADTVRAFDGFRAPPDAADLARRRTASLTPDQDANLIRWGYPYVMSAFRFHITLTGKRPKSELPVIREVLDRHLMPVVPRPFPIESLSLMGEDSQGRFHVIRRQKLGGG